MYWSEGSLCLVSSVAIDALLSAIFANDQSDIHPVSPISVEKIKGFYCATFRCEFKNNLFSSIRSLWSYSFDSLESFLTSHGICRFCAYGVCRETEIEESLVFDIEDKCPATYVSRLLFCQPETFKEYFLNEQTLK